MFQYQFSRSLKKEDTSHNICEVSKIKKSKMALKIIRYAVFEKETAKHMAILSAV